MALLAKEGYSLDSFAGLGPKESMQWIQSNTLIDAQATYDKQLVVIKGDVNSNLRAFYICLLDWCLSAGKPNSQQQSTLERFKRLAYRTDPDNHDY